jgi:hypothetical protein
MGAVVEGWRQATIDIDLAFGPDHDAVLRPNPAIKEALDINAKLASPAGVIPVKSGWRERSPFRYINTEQQGNREPESLDFNPTKTLLLCCSVPLCALAACTSGAAAARMIDRR